MMRSEPRAFARHDETIRPNRRRPAASPQERWLISLIVPTGPAKYAAKSLRLLVRDVEMKPLKILAPIAFCPLVLATAVPANGQDVMVNDARCYLVAHAFANAGNEREKQIAVQAVLFYLGRLSGTPQAVQAELATQARTVANDSTGELMGACTRYMTSRVAEIEAVYQAVAESQRR